MKYDAAIEGAEFGGMVSPKPGTAFCVAEVCVVETENSIWTLVANAGSPGGKYNRAPKEGVVREVEPAIAGRLDDGVWHEYEWATWTGEEALEGEIRLNIKPVVGPVDGRGIFTGVVQAVRAY